MGGRNHGCEDLAAVHAGMSSALHDELRELERRGIRDTVEVHGGVLIEERPQEWRYRFELQQRTGALRPGRDVGFESDDGLFSGTVVGRKGAHVVVAFGETLGPQAQAGRLVTDSRWLLIALRRRLRDVESIAARDPAFHSAAALRVIGEHVPAIGSARITCTFPALNDEQRRLVELGHGAELLALWGPAGTGKTLALIYLIASLMDDGQRVLYLAPTNLAVDGLLERGSALFRQRSWWRDGAVLRVGPLDGVSLTSEERDRYCLDAVLLRQANIDRLSPAQYRRLAESMVRSASLTAATTHQSFLSPLLTLGGWDVLVVDEASMVAPAILYAASGLARRTILAGDFRQLGPIAHARTNVARRWLRTDPFHMLGIPQEIARGGDPPNLVMLREQYRMAEDIASVVQPAYFHQLATHESVRQRPHGPLGPDGVFVLDSSSMSVRVGVATNGSRFNEGHARIAGDVFARALARGRLNDSTLRDVLVIAPFVAQTQLLAESLRARFGRVAPRIRTIHRAQGCEADIVLLDLTEASNAPVSRFFSGRDFTCESARLLTVAVTRARRHLIVIGDMPHMLRSRSVGIVVRRMVEAISAGRNIDVERIRRSIAA
ncbi:MAG: DEAD/DEAH box helicase [Longimicrobiales bacterium]